jgi:hypothetical protein
MSQTKNILIRDLSPELYLKAVEMKVRLEVRSWQEFLIKVLNITEKSLED